MRVASGRAMPTAASAATIGSASASRRHAFDAAAPARARRHQPGRGDRELDAVERAALAGELVDHPHQHHAGARDGDRASHGRARRRRATR